METVGKARSVKTVHLILALVLASQAVGFAAASGTHALGTIYYVDGTYGSDGNPGTFGQPWRTIQKAANTMRGGDTVFIRAGTYNQRVTLEYKANSSGPYITFAAYPGEQVILDGTGIGILYGGGLFHIWETDYIRVSGLRVRNSNGAGIYVAYSEQIVIEGNYTYDTVKSGVGVWGSNNVIVDGNDIELACNPHGSYGQSEENITIAASSNVEVRNNHVHDGPAGLDPARAGGEGINVKDGSHGVMVHDNVVHDLDKLGFGLDAWLNGSYDIEFFGNVAYNVNYGFIVSSEQGGIIENVKVYNNIAYNNGGAGFAIPWWSGTTDGLKRNIQFINNTSYGNDYGLRIRSPQNENIVVRNNIFSENGIAIQIVSGAVAQTTIDHNLFYGSGDPMGSDYVIDNPLFVDPAGGDFHLQGSSPAIDTGSPIDAPNADFDGNPRPWGAGYDIGASEYTLGAPYEWPYSIYLPFVTRGHRSP